MQRLIITVAALWGAGSAPAQMDRRANPDLDKDGWLSKGEILTLRQNRGREAG